MGNQTVELSFSYWISRQRKATLIWADVRKRCVHTQRLNKVESTMNVHGSNKLPWSSPLEPRAGWSRSGPSSKAGNTDGISQGLQIPKPQAPSQTWGILSLSGYLFGGCGKGRNPHVHFTCLFTLLLGGFPAKGHMRIKPHVHHVLRNANSELVACPMAKMVLAAVFVFVMMHSVAP